MNITEISHKIKAWIQTNTGQTVLILLILVASNMASFYVGKSSTAPIKSVLNPSIQATGDYSLADPEILKEGTLAAAVAASKTTKGQQGTTQAEESYDTSPRYVASKNGRVYYFTWCAGGKKIAAENRVYFETANEAKEAGLTPSTACEGLD